MAQYFRILYHHNYGQPVVSYSDRGFPGWHYIADYNRRFTVAPKNTADAHLAYSGTAEELARTLSVQVTRTLSKNLSCQYENQLLQIETTGAGLGLRGAKVTVHEHFDGRCELLWKKRKLTYSVMEKPRRQASVADSKTINPIFLS